MTTYICSGCSKEYTREESLVKMPYHIILNERIEDDNKTIHTSFDFCNVECIKKWFDDGMPIQESYTRPYVPGSWPDMVITGVYCDTCRREAKFVYHLLYFFYEDGSERGFVRQDFCKLDCLKTFDFTSV